MFYNPRMNGLRSGLGLVLAATLTTACGSTTFKPRRIVAEPFLASAGLLEASTSGLPRTFCLAKAALPARPRIVVESPSIWRTIDVPVLAVPEADFERLSRTLHDVVCRELQDACDIELAPDPGVLRLRLAVTEPAQAWVVFDTFTVHLPRERLAAQSDTLATSTAAFLGGATIEAELVDPATGRVLLAAAGPISEPGTAMPPSWSELTERLDRWADALLVTLRRDGGTR